MSKTHTVQVEFVGPEDSPVAGQMIGLDLMLALAVATVVRRNPKLIPALQLMQNSR